MSRSDRVAVIVVHGIADQRAGQTVRELTRLLCHGGDGKPRYVQGELHQVLVPVTKLEPGGAASPAATFDSTGDAQKRRGAPSGFYQTQRSASVAAEGRTRDLSVAMTDYLLGQLRLSDRDALYESTRVSLRRQADDRRVDVFELYWADLSRLGKGRLRTLIGLYQLFFGVGTLAPNVVDQITLSVGKGMAWRVLRRIHACLAWLMKCPVALILLSILLLALFGAAVRVPLELREQFLPALFAISAIALTAVALLAWLREVSPAARSIKLVLLLSAAVVAYAMAGVASRDDGDLTKIYFGTSAVGIAVLGAWLVEIYSRITQGVRVFGHFLIFSTVLGLCLDGYSLLPKVTTLGEWMLTAAMNVGEILLAALLVVWAVYVVLQTAAIALGLWLRRGVDRAVRQSLETSSLAVVASTALFAVLGVVVCSVINYIASDEMTDFLYLPIVFGSGYRSGAIFLDSRIRDLAGFFLPLALAFTVLGLATVVVLAPSLMEEIFPTTNVDGRGRRHDAIVWSERLGKWLRWGLGGLRKTFAIVVQPGAVVGGVLYLALLYRRFAFSADVTGQWAKWTAGGLDYILESGRWLGAGALIIAAVGSRFSTLSRLRVMVDAALDVDNYFRDPPDRQPPRGRIFSRYASLLAYVCGGDYARVVIVSHSQGTVISADLLRYLHVQQRLSEFVGRTPIALVTVGSPLRELYAERFPLLYRWMGSNAEGFAIAGPKASDIGAIEWVNAFRSGDYVGRSLWMEPGHSYPIALVGPDGKLEADRAGDRVEFCLGAGAHTHYFSNDAVALGVEIDRLIAG